MKIKDFRSKIIKTFSLIVVLLLLCYFNISYAETITYKDIHSRTNNVYEVNNYYDLYSVFEDLNYDYERALEEIDDLNNQIKENGENYNKKLEELSYLLEIDSETDIDDTINSLQNSVSSLKSQNGLYSSIIIILVIIIIFMGLTIYSQNKE